MTEKFIQGVAPFFIGLELSNGTQVLENLRDNLNACGWIITDNISTNDYFLAQGKYDVYDEDNNYIQTDQCWVKFTDDTLGNIIVNGDYDGTNNYLSSNFLVPYSTTNSFRLFGGFNEQAGCFCIYNNFDSTPTIEGSHFGFLSDRAELLDNTSIYIGNLSVNSWIFVECALDFYSSLIKWKRISNDFFGANAWDTSSNSNYPVTVLDYLVSTKEDNRMTFVTNNRNAGYKNNNGRKNLVTNQPIPVPYSLCEGRGSTTNYPANETLENKSIGVDLPLRGFIQYVKSGCRKEITGRRIIDRKNEQLLISKEVGGLAMQCGRIKRIKAVLDTPIILKIGLSDILAVYDTTSNYVLNTDFTVDYPNNTITFLSSGNITIDSIIMVSYSL